MAIGAAAPDDAPHAVRVVVARTAADVEVPAVDMDEQLWLSGMDMPTYATMYRSLYAKLQVHML